MLFGAEGLHRFDGGGAACGAESGNKDSDQEQGRCADIANRVEGRDAEEESAEEAHGDNGAETAGDESDEGGGGAAAKDEAEDASAGGSQSHAESKLAVAFEDGVRHYGIESDQGHKDAGEGVYAEQLSGDAGRLVALAYDLLKGTDVFEGQEAILLGDGRTESGCRGIGRGGVTDSDDGVGVVVLGEREKEESVSAGSA
jgi:hypothetical protein